MGLAIYVEELTSEYFIGGITDALAGDGFCGQGEDPAACAEAIQVLIPLALPTLIESWDETIFITICNDAFPGTC